jgi:hypothetical protein
MKTRLSWLFGGAPFGGRHLLPALALAAILATSSYAQVRGVQDGPDITPPPPNKITYTDIYATAPDEPLMWVNVVLDDGAPWPPVSGNDACHGGTGAQTDCCNTCNRSGGGRGWLESAVCTETKKEDGSTEIHATCIWRPTGPGTFPWP